MLHTVGYFTKSPENFDDMIDSASLTSEGWKRGIHRVGSA